MPVNRRTDDVVASRIDGWLPGLRTTSGVRYVVVVGDSFGMYGATAFPWVLERYLLGMTNAKGRPVGWRFAGHDPSPSAALAPRFDTQDGGLNATLTGGYGATLAHGDRATLAGHCDGLSVVHRTAPGAGKLVIRDGVGGPVLGTIDTDGPAGMGIWTSDALPPADRTFELEATGAAVDLDGAYLTCGNRTDGIRVISASRSGVTSRELAENRGYALELLEHLAGLGQLALVLCCTGTNDMGPVGWQDQLIEAVLAAVPHVPVVSWLPPISKGYPPDKYVASRAAVLATGVPVIDATVLGRIDGIDDVHPTPTGHQMIAGQIATVLSDDPIGARSRIVGDTYVPLAGGTMTGTLNLPILQASSAVRIGEGAVLVSPDAGQMGIATPLGSVTGQTDGEYQSRYIRLNAAASDPPAPAADHAVIYTRDDGTGRTQLCVRFATGDVQVLATEQ